MVLMVMGMARAPGASSEPSVTLHLFQFSPDTLVIPTGTRVTWTNTDDVQHTVTTGDADHADGKFAGSLAAKGATTTFTFERPGTYPYFCDRHHFMRGLVRVTPS
jgi:plastocyanin